MKHWLADLLSQAWTLLGMGVAWVVLDGSAKTVVGYSIVLTAIVWAATYWLRNPKDKE
jgi:hypothetical protein